MEITISDLPNEILVKIFSYLKCKHRNTASLVCSQWRDIMNCSSLQCELRLKETIDFNEPPLSLLKENGRKFSSIIFDSFSEFPEEIWKFYSELCESVKTITFSNCFALDNEILDQILIQFMNVRRIVVTGSKNLYESELSHKHGSVEVLDFSGAETPDWYIENYVKSFPNLKELIVSSSTYHLWDAREDCAINFNENATHTAFGDWVKRLCRMSKKVTLHYNYGMVSKLDTLLKELIEIPNLEVHSLYLHVKSITTEVFRTFCEVKGSKLNSINIRDAQIILPECLEPINKHCINLHKLILMFSEPNTFMILEKLADLKNLEEVQITGYEDKEVELTSKQLYFNRVHTLEISYVSQHTNLLSFEMILKALPRLNQLKLMHCKVSKEMLRLIYNLCQNLEILVVNTGEEIVDEDLYPEGNISLNSLTNLEELHLLNCYFITNTSLKKFNFKRLLKLELQSMRRLSSEGINELCKNCPKIRLLDLSDCRLIDDACVEIISKSLLNLNEIILIDTSITTKTLELIVENCKNIQKVHISITPDPDSESTKLLLKKKILQVTRSRRYSQ